MNSRCMRALPSLERPADVELTLLMPCLDEARTVGACVSKARGYLEQARISGEVLVADNGSRDASVAVAERSGARVLHVLERGYGAALAAGLAAARGRYVILADSDDSYDWSALDPFVERLRAGDELVMGNRFRGEIQSGAMPFLHRYLGNPVLTAVGRWFFGSTCGDFYCGQRGLARRVVEPLDLRSTGMEFALEMLVKATLLGLRVSEVPIALRPDGRGRRSHLRTWRDGWRSLRFFLLYSPRWLFLYPGLLLMVLGAVCGAWLLPAARTIGGLRLDVHTLLYCAVAVSHGFQLVAFALFGKVLAIVAGLHPPSRMAERFVRELHLEHGLIAGILLVLGGIGLSVAALLGWAETRFGDLDPFHTMRMAIPGALLLTLGCQVIGSSFYFSLLKMPWRERFERRESEAGVKAWKRAA